MTEEGEEDIIFVLTEAVFPTVSAGAISPLSVDENNRADGAEANDAQCYYRDVHRIYVWKTWWSFSVKGLLLTMITIQHRRISLDRVKLILAQVIGGYRLLFPPVNTATFKILSLVSDIIHMMPSLVCHFFSGFLSCSQRTVLRKSSLPRPTRV